MVTLRCKLLVRSSDEGRRLFTVKVRNKDSTIHMYVYLGEYEIGQYYSLYIEFTDYRNEPTCSKYPFNLFEQ